MPIMPRTCVPELEYNGKKANTELDEFLQSVEYTDSADAESDTIDIEMQNIEKRWLKGWWPKKRMSLSQSSFLRIGTHPVIVLCSDVGVLRSIR